MTQVAIYEHRLEPHYPDEFEVEVSLYDPAASNVFKQFAKVMLSRGYRIIKREGGDSWLSFVEKFEFKKLKPDDGGEVIEV